MKKQTLSVKDLRNAMNLLNKYEVKEFIVTFMKVWPFITIERANILRIGKTNTGKTIDEIVKKAFKKGK